MKINNPFSNKYFFILLPLIMVMIFDLVFTIAGQPEYYWRDFKFFSEGSPIGQWLIPIGPQYFILFFVFYFIIVLFLIVNFPRPLNIMAGISFFLGHVWGSSTWVVTLFGKIFPEFKIDDWYLVIGYFIIIGIISGASINHGFIKKIEK